MFREPLLACALACVLIPGAARAESTPLEGNTVLDLVERADAVGIARVVHTSPGRAELAVQSWLLGGGGGAEVTVEARVHGEEALVFLRRTDGGWAPVGGEFAAQSLGGASTRLLEATSLAVGLREGDGASRTALDALLTESLLSSAPDALAPTARLALVDQVEAGWLKALALDDALTEDNRAWAARALGARGEAGAAAALRSLALDARTPRAVRAGALEGLGHLGPAGADAAMMLLGDPDPTLRQLAAEALGRAPSSAAAEALTDQLEIEDDLFIQAALLSALGRQPEAARLAAAARLADLPMNPAIRNALDAKLSGGAR